MKYVLTIFAALVLVGCNQPTEHNDNNTDAPNVIDARNAGSQKLDPKSISQLGEKCGPSSEKLCASGLSCQFEGTNQDTGMCLPTIVNADLECDETQAPVCGLIGTNKNGYLNECYAKRYGAVVVSDGFCKPDPAVANNCEARAYSLGNCQTSFTGAFKNNDGKCEAVTMVGCDIEVPFESVEACEAACS